MRFTTSHKSRRARRPRGIALIAVPAVAFAIFAGGCGSDDSSDTSATTTASSAPAEDPTASQDTAASGTERGATGSGPVDIVDFDYDPKTVTVDAGSKLEFVNKDAAAHTATADDSSFDTDTLNKGDSATVTLDEPGTYGYYCRFHAFMKATVVVK